MANLAVALVDLRQMQEARDLLAICEKLAPADPDVQETAARALLALGEYPKALGILQRILQRDANRFDTWMMAGLAFQRIKRMREAVGCWEKAAALSPASPAPPHNIARTHWLEQRVGDAWASCERALALAKDDWEIYGLAADIQAKRGHFVEAVDLYRRSLKLKPDASELHNNMLVSLNFVPELSPREIFDEHRLWAIQHADKLTPGHASFVGSRDPDRRLRVGYVMQGLRRHAVLTFFESLLHKHDRQHFSICGYASLEQRDDLTEETLPLFDEFHDIQNVSDEQLADMIRADQIDILVDLAGHMQDHRLLTFARKPAPIQINSVAYPNTTGLLTMDYRFTDDIADPPGDLKCHTEELLRLPTGFCCYMSPREQVSVGPLPALANGYITFGATHTLQKMNSKVLDLYAGVMKAIPDSRILLFRSTLSPAQQGHFRDEFLCRGIELDRVDMKYEMPASGTHLSAYNEMDLHLDSFPWTGHTTTCDALWMGVPTITLMGNRHASRMAASVLHRVGLDDFVARDLDHFIQIARDWAKKIDELASLRQSIRDRMKVTLSDGVAYTKAVEKEYRNAWTRWCNSPVP